VDSYVRRQDCLQQRQAVHVLNAYAEAMSGGKGNRRDSAAHNGATKVSADELLQMMGVQVK
jgi:hypothetical protein